MTQTYKEDVWNDQQKYSLQRIKDDLVRSIKESKNFGGRTGSAEVNKQRYRPPDGYTDPYPRQTHTPPSKLPKMSSPDQDYETSGGNLRGSKYNIVPPVKTYQAFDRRNPPLYDNGVSVRAEDKLKDSRQQRKPKSIFDYKPKRPAKVHFTPNTDDMEYFDKYNGRGRPPQVLSVDRERNHNFRQLQDEEQSIVPYSRQPYNRNKQSQDYRNKYRLSDWYSYRPSYRNDLGRSSRYNINPYYPRFPLTRTLYGEHSSEPLSHPFFHPSAVVSDDLLREELDHWTRDIVRQTTNEIVDQYLMEQYDKHDPLDDFLNSLLDELMQECCRDVVKTTVHDLAEEYIRKSAVFDEAIDILTELTQDFAPFVISDAMDEVSIENIIDELVEEEITHTCNQVAMETLSHYNNKIHRRELKQVSDFVMEKQLDSMLMDYLLSVLVRQGRLLNEDDYAAKLLNSMILSTLLGQYMKIHQTRQSTLSNKPMKKRHRNLTAGVAVDVLLDELGQCLEEDLEDIDFYEHGDTM